MDYSNDEKQSNAVENCQGCGGEIKTMAFRGTGWCGIDCKKKAGLDVSSTGTIMFVSSEEKTAIEMGRENPNTELGLIQNNRIVGTPRSIEAGRRKSPRFQRGSEAGCYS